VREKIIARLSELHGHEKESVSKLVESCQKITPYTTLTVKDRCVINKSNIPLEEQIVLDYYKYLMNFYGEIKFPNRSYIMTELMNIMPYLHLYKTYTIYKFDFQGFFYNVDCRKSFNTICQIEGLRQNEINFFKKYTSIVSEYMPGIGLHNSLIEISGQGFDSQIKKIFRKKGLLYYARYVDDCILILDEKVSESLIKAEITKTMKACFGSKLILNSGKTNYYNSDVCNYEINYLGYVFAKGQSPKSQYKFGIAQEKLKKYKERINSYILEYDQTNNVELLSFKLEFLFKRIVYFGERKGDGKYRWQVRGISDSYKELKRFMNNKALNEITNETQKIFNKSIEECFKKNRVKIPAKINNQLKNDKFISCFINNKALLLHRKIGLTPPQLKKRLNLLYKDNVENLSYSELASLLIKNLY